MVHIHVDALRYDRDDGIVLRSLSFDVVPGSCLVVRGKNGSGKTTLLKLLGGILSPTTGEILISPEETKKFYLGHMNALKPHLTVKQYLKTFSVPYQSFLSSVFLDRVEESLIQTLSAGMKRRLAFAPAILKKSPLWLLDEPFTHMDTRSRQVIQGFMDQHCDQGGVIVMTDHESLTVGQELSL